MAQAGFVFPIPSNETTQFTDALANNVAGPVYNLRMPIALANRRCLIRAITVITKENFAPEFNFFSGAAGVNADPALDLFIARFGFVAAAGIQFAGAGVFRYYIDGMAIPYFDLDTQGGTNPSTLHVALANRSATAKSAGAAGNIIATFHLEPMQEW